MLNCAVSPTKIGLGILIFGGFIDWIIPPVENVETTISFKIEFPDQSLTPPLLRIIS